MGGVRTGGKIVGMLIPDILVVKDTMVDPDLEKIEGLIIMYVVITLSRNIRGGVRVLRKQNGIN